MRSRSRILPRRLPWALLHRIPRRIRRPAALLAALLLVLLLVISALRHSRNAAADPPNPALQLQWGGVQIRAAAVDPQIIHLVVSTGGGVPVPPSPFVVEREKTAVMAASPPGQASVLRIQSLRFLFYPTGALELKDGPDQTLISRGSIRSVGGSIVFSFQHHPGERLYGGGNAGMGHSGGLIHNEGVSTVANGVSRPAFLWSTGGWGVFIATNESGVSWLDDGSRQTWTVPGSTADIYLLAAPDPYQLLDAYTRLTGRAPLPPRWTFGYLQSRWGYRDADDVQQKWAEFRRLQIPVDAFIYDYDWFVNDWDFNPKTFPDPAADLAKMHALGLHFVGIRKPRVYDAHFDEAQKKDWILTGHDLNFDLPAVRNWWWSHQEPLVKDGVDGWWNDEAEQKYDEFFFMVLSEWDGAKKMDSSPGRKRVWSLNRAFTPGMQRLGAAVWTGDIQSSWDSLENQPGTLLDYGLCGMSFCGQDIGGFIGTPDAELYTRWMQEGVFVPVMRAHGDQNSDRWPWSFGPAALAAVKEAITLRYRLIPYLYSNAAVTAETGAPLMRPIFLEFPHDRAAYNLEDEWLVGRWLLAAPILSPGGRRTVHLPEGIWYDFHSGQRLAGPRNLAIHGALNTIPLYVRGGSILPLGPVLQSTSLGPEDPMEIRIYPGADASFTLYEDDGSTYEYLKRAGSGSSRIVFQWDDRRRVLSIGSRTGSFSGMLTTRHFLAVLPGGVRREVVYNGSAVTVQ